MPWCEPCARYFTPSGLDAAGACPTCGAKAAMHSVSGNDLNLKELAGDDYVKAPWHFKLLVTLLVLYLGWRVIDLFA